MSETALTNSNMCVIVKRGFSEELKLNLSERGWVGCWLVCCCWTPEGKSTTKDRSQEGQGAGVGGERQVGCCLTGILFVCLFARQRKQPNKQTLEKTFAYIYARRAMYLAGFRLKAKIWILFPSFRCLLSRAFSRRAFSKYISRLSTFPLFALLCLLAQCKGARTRNGNFELMQNFETYEMDVEEPPDSN